MWPVTYGVSIEALVRGLDDAVFYIADGHHRYETSLALRKYLVKKSPLFAGDSDYLMAYFTPIEHPGLVIFPYHRILHHLPRRRFTGFMKKLKEYFNVDRALVSPLEPGEPRRDFVRELGKRGQAGTAIGMVDSMKGESYFLSLKPDAEVRERCESEVDVILAGLDVVILEELILIGMLGIKPRDLLNEKHVTYETDFDRVFDAVHSAPNQLAFIMNPTKVDDVVKVSDHGGVMPEKSTYFFPKLATGLIINDIEA